MAKKDDIAKQAEKNKSSSGNVDYVYQKRRYVGTKETIFYVIFDMAQSFNINTYNDRFVTNILLVALKLQRRVTLINGIWDIINDIFTGTIVDKTRTRWGKFKPYLMLLAIPGTILTCTYWLMPTFLSSDPYNTTKFVFYLILAMIREGIGTFQGIAQTGLQATLTPHPVDRTRLITIANFFSGFLGEKLPEQITTVFMDLIAHGVIGTPRTSYRKLYIGMGTFTTCVSGLGALLFFLVARERVMQSIETPSIMQGIKAIVNNKPILLITLSEMLSGFSVGGSKSDYYTEVLKFSSLGFITGIPGSIVHPFAYALVPWFRRHFSSRVLYIMGTYIGSILMVPVFLIGSIGGMKHGLYKKVWVAGILLTLWETIFMFFYGVRKVIPAELYNESMDYCEWKNGYRCESMTSVAKGLAKKGTAIVSSYLSSFIKDKIIGYDQTAWTKGAAQSDKAQFGLFAMFTIIPFVTSSLGIIPILFYDLTGKKRERMYAELLLRREAVAKEATVGDADTLAKVAKTQMEGSHGENL